MGRGLAQPTGDPSQKLTAVNSAQGPLVLLSKPAV